MPCPLDTWLSPLRSLSFVTPEIPCTPQHQHPKLPSAFLWSQQRTADTPKTGAAVNFGTLAPLKINCVLQSPLFSLKKSHAEHEFLSSELWRIQVSTSTRQQLCHSSSNRVLKSSFYQFLFEHLLLPALSEALLPSQAAETKSIPICWGAVNKICSWILCQEQGKGREDEGEKMI